MTKKKAGIGKDDEYLISKLDQEGLDIKDFEEQLDEEEKEALLEPISDEDIKKIEQKRRKKLRNEVTHKLRFDVLERDNFRCVNCGASPKTNSEIELVVDHILPLDKGGDNSLTNLATLCRSCNEGKKDRILAVKGFEREYQLPIEEILKVAATSDFEEFKKFLTKKEHEEARLYLYDLYRQKNELRCIRDCVTCISSGHTWFKSCMEKLYYKVKYNNDDKRAIGNDESLQRINPNGLENIYTSNINRLQCDTCYISRRCPAYKLAASCTFDFSADIDFLDTKSAIQLIVNVQRNRVLRGSFFELIDGGALDKNLSNEIALTAQLLKAVREVTSPTSRGKVTIEAEGSDDAFVDGLLNSIFGEKENKDKKLETSKVKSLPEKTITDNSIENAVVIPTKDNTPVD
jgi:hypothetical protein